MLQLTENDQSVSRPTANPGPLGLAGFGLTTVVLSCVNAGLMPHEAIPVIVPLAFAYGGVAQIIAGILEFRTGNTFGMVAFLSYGLFWWWFALLQWTVGAGWLAQPPASAVASVLLMWGVLTFLLWIVTFRLSLGVWSIFLLLWLTFFFLAAGDFGYLIGSVGCGTIGGYLGILTGVDALLVAFVEILNATASRIIIPLGRPIFRN
ncbi:acetate uptake transporter [Edaphobacter paludis]|uniref:Acetate uptake transporter n=1 Tax=Edaphobacter paludis TaxID=3035702 RepID=A0AAU7D5M1_9BACT